MSFLKNREERDRPSFIVALSILLFLIAALVIQVVTVGSADAHMTFFLTISFGAIILLLNGISWKRIEEGIIGGCKDATHAMIILMLVGILIPALISSGSIPVLIYWGMQMISPKIFLPTVAIVCTIASLATGSAWTSAATFGVAAMGIGIGLGIPSALTAGAVISGAVVGDKLSPLSDTTNLAPAVSGTDLFSHIKSMFYTTGPALLIALVLYAVLGAKYGADSINSDAMTGILTSIEANFNVKGIGLILGLIPFAMILIMAFKKVSGIATMVAAALVAALFGILMNGYSILDMMSFMNFGFVIDAGNADVNSLLNRGGLQGMMYTVSLGYFGLAIGGLLEKTGCMEVLLEKMSVLLSKQGNLILTHVLTCISVNLFTASQYLSIMIPGKLYAPAYDKLGIKRYVCSRTCEDAGTVTSPLVPWNMCGAYFAATLGVATMEYLPFAFVPFLSPVIAVIYGYFNLFIFKNTPEEQAEIEKLYT